MNFQKFLISSAIAAGSVGSVCGATSWTADANHPEPQVSEWSYGLRDAVPSTSQTLFALAPRKHSIPSFPGIQSWQNLFMAGAQDVSRSATGNPGPAQLTALPMSVPDPFILNVVRWTAPITGTFQLSTSRDGVDAKEISLLNRAVGVYDRQTTPRNLPLSAGTLLDSVVGPGAAENMTNDSTTFGTFITLMPKATSMLLLAAAVSLFFVRRRAMNSCR